jgi:hypothetical protein
VASYVLRVSEGGCARAVLVPDQQNFRSDAHPPDMGEALEGVGDLL